MPNPRAWVSGALYGPNSNGAVGYVAKAVSPQIAYKIGQAFKENDYKNRENNNTELAGEGSPKHLLAHTILGAAVSYATGNDALTGGVSAAAGEAAAPLLMKYLYDTKDPSELTAEQKDTISSITSLTGTVIGATTGNVTDAVNAGETAKVAVENNHLTSKTDNSWLKKDITYKSFNDAIAKCKSKGNGCKSEIEKYCNEHQANFQNLKERCGDGGLECPAWEEHLTASLNTAKKLEDPDARKIAVLMLTQDLILLENGIDVWDRTYDMVTDPLAVATVVATRKPSGAGKALSITKAKTILKNAGITSIGGMTIDIGLQKLINGEINYRDVMASGLSGAVFGTAVGGNSVKAPSATSGSKKTTLFDISYRTPLAETEGLKVVQAMEGIVSKRKAKSVTVMVHNDGKVSVGISDDLSREGTSEIIKNESPRLYQRLFI